MESTAPLRVLVVDDNVSAAKMLGLLLSKLGAHQVSLAHDGAEALRAASEHSPDLILLDIGLPKMDGYEVVRALRQQPQFARTLVVALTGFGTDEDRERSLGAGCDAHLVKPPAVADLRDLLANPRLSLSGDS